MNDEAVNEIPVPLARLIITYGLDENGDEIICEQCDNYADDNQTPVSAMTKYGMLAMAESSVTINSTIETMED